MSGENQAVSSNTENNESSSSNYRLPQGVTLQHCAKLGIVEDKPIMFDYWTASCDKEVIIGVRVFDPMRFSQG